MTEELRNNLYFIRLLALICPYLLHFTSNRLKSLLRDSLMTLKLLIAVASEDKDIRAPCARGEEIAVSVSKKSGLIFLVKVCLLIDSPG